MRNQARIALAAVAFLVLSGCGLVGPYEMRGEQMLTLDQAMARATTTSDLWALHSQAEQAWPDDRIVIEELILNVSLESQDTRTLEMLSRLASSEEIKNTAANAVLEHERVREAEAKRVREEQQVQAQKKAEEIRLAMKENRQRLIRDAAGRLDDKSAEEVKRLIDNWRTPQGSLQVNPYDFDVWQQYINDYKDSFHTSDFYKAFGQPQRKQLISGDGNFSPDHYYFYYQCSDGTAQIEIDADSLSKENLVLVSGLNIL